MIIVTGGAGFIGKQQTLNAAVYGYVVNYLQKCYHLGQEREQRK